MTKQNWEKEFDEIFYEGKENSIFCRKHDLPVSPFEIKSFIFQTFEQERQERQKMVEEIYDMLISSLPKDAENLSLLTPYQAREVIKNFLDKLKEL